ncbi:hypothetical protein V6N13_055146 [Hibiscus sabdariffa]
MFDLAINTTLDQKPKVAAQTLFPPLYCADFSIPGKRDCAIFSAFGKEFPKFCSLVYSGGLSRDLDEIFVEIQDPSKWFHQENKSCDFLRVFLLGAFSPGFEERRSSFRDLTI